MDLKNHIKSVQSRIRGDWTENETIWSFEISEELYGSLREKMIAEVHRLYNKYTGNGTAIWSCPALGEYDDDFAWVFYGDSELPLNLYPRAHGGQLEIAIYNHPEDEFDRLDSDHPHWTSTPPMQWLEALCAVRQIVAN